MFKFLLNIISRREAPRHDAEMTLHWLRDPLAHPDLEQMNQRELGDLAFRR